MPDILKMRMITFQFLFNKKLSRFNLTPTPQVSFFHSIPLFNFKVCNFNQRRMISWFRLVTSLYLQHTYCQMISVYIDCWYYTFTLLPSLGKAIYHIDLKQYFPKKEYNYCVYCVCNYCVYYRKISETTSDSMNQKHPPHIDNLRPSKKLHEFLQNK